MPSWKYLTRFVAAEDGATYYSFTSDVPKEGERVQSFDSIDGPERQASSKHTTVQKIIAPIAAGNPIVCIGLNYSNHAKEASVRCFTRFPLLFVELTCNAVSSSNHSTNVVQTSTGTSRTW